MSACCRNGLCAGACLLGWGLRSRWMGQTPPRIAAYLGILIGCMLCRCRSKPAFLQHASQHLGWRRRGNPTSQLSCLDAWRGCLSRKKVNLVFRWRRDMEEICTFASDGPETPSSWWTKTRQYLVLMPSFCSPKVFRSQNLASDQMCNSPSGSHMSRLVDTSSRLFRQRYVFGGC